jgi:hypothetical protein
MDLLTPEINRVIERWGNAAPVPLPSENQLASEYERVLLLLAAQPPDYQAGRLSVSRDRIAQARRRYIWQAVAA